MKKLLLLLSFLFVAFAASAGDLNPFAYNLKSTFDESTMTLSVSFNVNARAKSIKVIIVDSQKNEYLLHDFGSQDVANNYGYQASLNNLVPQGERFTWRVDVEGYPVNVPTVIESSIQNNKLFYPTSVDIDNNPENANFGTVFCIEGREASGDYLSTKNQQDGPGLYLFNADGTPRKLPFLGETIRYSYNGGKKQKNEKGVNISLGAATGFPSYRVRVSDDGRIFITGQRASDNASENGNPLHVLWEAHKERFSATTEAEWRNSKYTNWINVISSANTNTYSFGNITVGSGTGNVFYGGPNMGFDLRGSGDGLKLLMLSGNKDFSSVRCDEYNLGDEIIWEKAPSQHVFDGHAATSAGAQVQYDKNGNVWMCQLRYETDLYTLIKFSPEGNILYEEDPKQAYRRSGAIRFNDNFTQFAVVSAGSTGKGGTITIYPVNDNGEPDFTKGQDINVADKIGLSIMDIAWDYAGNMYVAADGTSDSDYKEKGHCVGIFAMPRENNIASTPAASQYSFSTEYSVAWYNLFLHGQDVADDTKNMTKDGETIIDYSKINNRLWRLMQVGYMQYRHNVEGVSLADGQKVVTDVENKINNNVVNVDVVSYLTKGANGETLTSSVGFFADDPKFSWLGDYIEEVTGEKMDTKEKCAQYADDFINRKGDFVEKGKPDYWRPLFIKAVLGLNEKMRKHDYMPIQWNADEQYFTTDWVPGWGARVIWHDPEWLSEHGYQYAICPSNWYHFNTAQNRASEGIGAYTHILAWRDGSTTGDIVHHIDKPMKLHATYVEKKLDENDKDNSELDLASNPFDVTNDDLIQLMMNPNFRSATDTKIYSAHDYVKVSRKLQAGMYNTICLPLSNDQSLDKYLDLTQLHTAHPLYSDGNGAGATILEFTSITPTQNTSGEDMTMLNFTQVSKMQAGKPYLVKLKDGASDLIDDMLFTTQTSITPTPNTTAVSAHNELHPVSAEANGVTFTFVPTINPTKVPAGSLILVADNRLALTTEDGQMAGMRGYFTFSGLSAIDEEAIAEQAADGRVLLSVKRPVTTSLIIAPDSEQQTVPQVSKLMYDGQIYIIRDNTVYTITGVRVK